MDSVSSTLCAPKFHGHADFMIPTFSVIVVLSVFEMVISHLEIEYATIWNCTPNDDYGTTETKAPTEDGGIQNDNTTRRRGSRAVKDDGVIGDAWYGGIVVVIQGLQDAGQMYSEEDESVCRDHLNSKTGVASSGMWVRESCW